MAHFCYNPYKQTEDKLLRDNFNEDWERIWKKYIYWNAFNFCYEKDRRLFISNSEYESEVHFCPICWKKAKILNNKSKNMDTLTEKQQVVLDIITDFIGRYWKSPTIDELQKLLKQKSKRWAVQYLEALEKKGFITRAWGFRSIRINNNNHTWNITKEVSFMNDYGSMFISRHFIPSWSEVYLYRYTSESISKKKVSWKDIKNGSILLVDRLSRDASCLLFTDTWSFWVLDVFNF